MRGGFGFFLITVFKSIDLLHGLSHCREIVPSHCGVILSTANFLFAPRLVGRDIDLQSK